MALGRARAVPENETSRWCGHQVAAERQLKRQPRKPVFSLAAEQRLPEPCRVLLFSTMDQPLRKCRRCNNNCGCSSVRRRCSANDDHASWSRVSPCAAGLPLESQALALHASLIRSVRFRADLQIRLRFQHLLHLQSISLFVALCPRRPHRRPA